MRPADADADATAAPRPRVYNAWIWLIVAVSLAQLLPLLTIDMAELTREILRDPLYGQLAVMFSVGYLILLLFGWALFALSVVFAYQDWRALTGESVPRPFHWAWSFLAVAVYIIGRSVVARRRTGRGIAPMWIAIAIQVAAFVIAMYLVLIVFTEVFEFAQEVVRNPRSPYELWPYLPRPN